MKYKVGGGVSASTYIGEFEATTPEEAIEKAYNAAHVSVCHQCARGIQDPEVTDLWAEDESGNVTSEPSSHDKLVAAQAELSALRKVAACVVEVRPSCEFHSEQEHEYAHECDECDLIVRLNEALAEARKVSGQ